MQASIGTDYVTSQRFSPFDLPIIPSPNLTVFPKCVSTSSTTRGVDHRCPLKKMSVFAISILALCTACFPHQLVVCPSDFYFLKSPSEGALQCANRFPIGSQTLFGSNSSTRGIVRNKWIHCSSIVLTPEAITNTFALALNAPHPCHGLP